MQLDEEALQARLLKIEARFNAAKVARDQKEAELNAVLEESETEILKLQGEYRLVKQLLADITKPEAAE